MGATGAHCRVGPLNARLMLKLALRAEPHVVRGPPGASATNRCIPATPNWRAMVFVVLNLHQFVNLGVSKRGITPKAAALHLARQYRAITDNALIHVSDSAYTYKEPRTHPGIRVNIAKASNVALFLNWGSGNSLRLIGSARLIRSARSARCIVSALSVRPKFSCGEPDVLLGLLDISVGPSCYESSGPHHVARHAWFRRVIGDGECR